VRRSRSFLAVTAGVLIISCSDGTGPPPPPPLDCSDASTRVLAVGQHEILDPNALGACIRLPAAGPAGAEHLYVPLATQGQETPSGVSAHYQVIGGSPVAVSALPSPQLSAFQSHLPAQAFHSMLRARERALSEQSSVALFNQGRVASSVAQAPVVGEERSFDVCSSSTCKEFVQTTATAMSVGARVAIFVDDSAPAGGYTTTDLQDVGTLFDQFLYPIDTTAFGVESDIDGNGVVIVLLTHRVNALSPDCNNTGQVILGYFFGADLLLRGSDNPGSNQAEIFYGLVPDPDNPACTIDKAEAASRLPTTFIHEFQHMISFNQHVLVRQGASEDTWLNEGLSHFAEELGARLVPDTECPNSTSCFSEFLEGNILNAFEYLASPEEFFLIEPGNSSGKLEERGANWLFVRWLLDHFASDTILGTNLTRQLVETDQVGSANVLSKTGVDFSILVGEWQLTNHLDDLPGFSAPAARLRYKSWNFREVADLRGRPFPLVPDSTSGVGYNHRGILRAGSGRHIRVVQGLAAGEVGLQVTGSVFRPKRILFTGPLPSSIEPRIALVRVR
jgi:hypothetical protein